MDLKQVEKSLAKYWEGNSSIEEERNLQDFFSYGEVPPHLEMYKEVFITNEVDLNPSLGKDFDAEVLSKLEESKKGNTLWNVFKVAAIGLILIITSISVFKADTQEQLSAEDTFSNPEEALAETKKAFILIAEAMNKGEQPIQNLTMLDKTNQKIKKK